MEDIFLYSLVFLYGIMIGSFLNVCIYRIPKNTSIVSKRSHCMNCNTVLRWYDLIPIFSYICLWGKCRSCKSKISFQYPFVEALNGILYVFVFYLYGWDSLHNVLLNIVYCLSISALIVMSFIDIRTHIIPLAINIFLMVMGILALLIKYFFYEQSIDIVLNHAIGFFSVSFFLWVIFYISKGRAIGGGDIKLMAAAGLLLGWKLVILAFFLGCILAAIIHPIRMRFGNVGRVLAFGPYLSCGIIISLFFGEQIISWYIMTFFL